MTPALCCKGEFAQAIRVVGGVSSASSGSARHREVLQPGLSWQHWRFNQPFGCVIVCTRGPQTMKKQRFSHTKTMFFARENRVFDGLVRVPLV